MFKKSLPILYSKLQCKKGQEFMDIQYVAKVCCVQWVEYGQNNKKNRESILRTKYEMTNSIYNIKYISLNITAPLMNYTI